MNEPKLTTFLAIGAWLIFGIILLGIVFRIIPSDLISWLGLAIAFIIAIGASATGAILEGARRKRGSMLGFQAGGIVPDETNRGDR